MFQEFRTSKPSSHYSLYESGRVTLTTSKGPFQIGESLCQSLVICIFCKTKSPTLKLCELILRVWYHLIACCYFVDWMIAASHNSCNLVKSSTRESSDYSSENYCTWNDLCSTTVGNIAQNHKPMRTACGMWHDSESYAGPTEAMTTLLSTSRHKALAYQKF
jgi:hypothetical protein